MLVPWQHLLAVWCQKGPGVPFRDATDDPPIRPMTIVTGKIIAPKNQGLAANCTKRLAIQTDVGLGHTLIELRPSLTTGSGRPREAGEKLEV